MILDIEGIERAEEKKNEDASRCREIVTEINTIRRQTMTTMLRASAEIGKLLCEAKEKLPFGEWGGWLSENFEYSQSTANNLMRLFRAYGQPDQLDVFYSEQDRMELFGNLTPSQALALLPLSEPERREFVEAHDMTETSVRDIEAEIKARETAEAKASAAEEELESVRDDLTAEQHDRLMAEQEAKTARARAEAAEKALVDETERLKAEIQKAKTEAAGQQVIVENPVDLKAEKKKIRDKLQAEYDKKLTEEKKAIEDKLTAEQKRAGELEKQVSEARADAARELEAEYLKRMLALEDRAKVAEKKLATAGNAGVQKFAVYFENFQADYRSLSGILAGIRTDDAATAEKFACGLVKIMKNYIEQLEAGR